MASGQQNTPAQAATRLPIQHPQMPPPPAPVAYAPGAPMPPEMPQQQQFAPNPRYMSQLKQGRIGAWMDGRVDWTQDMDSNEDMAPPQGFTKAQNMAPGPAMPSHQATPHGQHHRRHHHKSSHRPKPEFDPQASAIMPPDVPAGPAGTPTMAPDPMISSPQDTSVVQQQMLHHSNPESGQVPQPYATIPPPEASAPGPPLAPAPVTSSHYAPSDRRRHGHRRHHNSSREPGAGPAQDPQPLSTIPPGPSMPAGMASPTVMAVPPAMPSAQDAHGGQDQRHRRVTSRVSHHEQAPLSLTAQPPPPTMRESMAVMAEEAIPAHPTQSLALRPGPPPPPGMPMPPECSRPSTQNLNLRAEVQEASRMSGTQYMQFPMGPPQAGTMASAAAGAFYMPASPMSPTMPGPPHPQSTRRRPRQGQQQPPPGMSSRASASAASAAGTPGPQAMAVRPSPGAPSGPPAMSSTSRREPPPTSMPPFPGTCPPIPGSMDMARSPPPPVPTPPPPLGDDD